MLIIGDLATQEHINNTINDIEIICKKEQKIFVRNYLNLEGNGIKINSFTTKWVLPENVNFYIYTYEGIDSLTSLVESTFSGGFLFKFANIDISYMLNIIKCSMIYKNVSYWKKITSDTCRLYNLSVLEKHYNSLKDNYLKELEIKSIKFVDLISSSDKILTDNYQLRPYDEYEEEDIHDIFALNNHKNYYDISYGTNNKDIHLAKWISLTRMQKLNCIKERIYAIATNEFLIPEYVENKHIPLNTDEILIRSFMILMNTVNDKFVYKFILKNFDSIEKTLNRSYYRIFENAVINNDIEKIK